QLTKNPLYKTTIEETIAFIDRELSNGEGGFYAALDADSEGIEGKYYVWDKAEIETLLKTDAALFCEYYGVTEGGNWEEKNILTRKDRKLSPEEEEGLKKSREILLKHRAGRIPPALDDKILLGWNALMNLACSKAYAALGDEHYRERAIRNMKFLQTRLKGEGIYFYYHSYKGAARYPAFLDDYACLVAALIGLQEITGETAYLDQAHDVTKEVIAHFGDPETGFFFYTHDQQQDVILRKKEVYDGATPSGNSTMAFNLLYLSVVFNEPEWAQRALNMTSQLARPVTGYPGSFGGWATLFQAFTYTISEVVITGVRPERARKEFLEHLIPYRVFQSTDQENTQFPLLTGKSVGSNTLIFLCKNYSCQLPVNEIATVIRDLENVYKFQP
ncbi:MAG: thioredoxin domain-containing protein, partial [Bacteroidetes bacterium]|nr:thioredoxin domain-containing protein [Bacteroidota bacterium]